jgi:very-short-patch-repair endonuclease
MKRRQLIHNTTALKDRRRELRRNCTKAEAKLWACLRNGQLDGKKFRRQHSIGPYIVDFYCPECRVVVELDGAAHSGILAAERDARRTEFLSNFGFQILRFENKEVFQNRE